MGGSNERFERCKYSGRWVPQPPTEDIDNTKDLKHDICIAKPSKVKRLVDPTALFDCRPDYDSI